MTLADDIDKQPLPRNGPVNQPASGTQGTKAATERLQQALPAPSPQAGPGGPGGAPSPVSAQGVTNVRSNRDAANLPGVPAALMHPTARPNTRVDEPLGAPAAPQLTGMQKRLQQLDLLANSPDVNEETRQWAKIVIATLVD